jgi:hypothetical protein
MAGATSCSHAANVVAPRASSMLDTLACVTTSGSSSATQSTMGHRWDRSARRIEKLRARLQVVVRRRVVRRILRTGAKQAVKTISWV